MRRSLLSLALLSLAAAALPAADTALEAQMKAVLGAYAIIERNAADPVDLDRALYQGAIPGLLRNLDPHSVFFDSSQFDQLRKMETSTQKGFGSVVSITPGRVIVLQALAGTPSAKAGLAPGDEVLAVNGYDIAQLDMQQISELLTQSRQRPAQLIVRRQGLIRPLELTLTPEELQEPSVDRVFFVGAGIGYIRVTSFEEKTPRQLKEAIEKLGGKRLAGLVLDLRDNPGGLLTAAIETASLFLKPEQTIVTVRGRNAPEATEKVPGIADPYDCKLAILVNEKSASASEILSGAVQDHDRGVIIGQPTFGKGLVQSVFPLPHGTALALTTALYYAPSGRSIQRPLNAQFELAGATVNPNGDRTFRTDKGRQVAGGGGIQPDTVVFPERLDRLRSVLLASGSFTNFATEFLRATKVTADFEITPEILEQFRAYVNARRIQPSLSEWISVGDFVSNHLLAAIFDQSLGVEKGDQIEARRDPVIQRAILEIGS
jgi:carboxyl-terminal processing protease